MVTESESNLLGRLGIPLVVAETLATGKTIANAKPASLNKTISVIVSDSLKGNLPEDVAAHISNTSYSVALDFISECKSLGWKEPLSLAKGKSVLEKVNTAVRNAIQEIPATGRTMESSMRQAGNSNRAPTMAVAGKVQKPQPAIR